MLQAMAKKKKEREREKKEKENRSNTGIENKKWLQNQEKKNFLTTNDQSNNKSRVKVEDISQMTKLLFKIYNEISLENNSAVISCFPEALLSSPSGAQPSHILPNSPSIDKAKRLQETRLPQRISTGGQKPAE